MARTSSLRMSSLAVRPTKLRVSDDHSAEDVEVPALAAELIAHLLSQLGDGKTVAIVPLETLLTRPQAAELLGVSLSFLEEEMEAGRLSFQTKGSDRRIHMNDLLDYRDKLDEARHQELDALAREAQALDLGY